jgi:hypothetical protein
MTIDLQATGEVEREIKGVLRILSYLCTGSPDHPEKRYRAFLLNHVLYEMLNEDFEQILQLPVCVLELEGVAIEQFSFQAICSLLSYDDRDFFVHIASMLERRVIVASADFKIAVFSDFNDFQIVLIDRLLMQRDEEITKSITSLVAKSDYYGEFEKDLNDAMQEIAQRIESINGIIEK